MSITDETFRAWAPDDSVWSAWTKPVLFSRKPRAVERELNPPEVSWAPYPDGKTALIVDLPAKESVLTGLALARLGYRPVALYNGVYGPSVRVRSMAVDVTGIVITLFRGAGFLASCPLSPDAPPAFLLDFNRLSGPSREVGKFDNRWCVFPQDMPSASFLLAHGVTTVCIRTGKVQNDLTHILRRYQEKGVRICRVNENGAVEELKVARPSRFRSVLYRVTTMMGLTRNAAGGFGGFVPESEQSSGGRFFGGG